MRIKRLSYLLNKNISRFTKMIAKMEQLQSKLDLQLQRNQDEIEQITLRNNEISNMKRQNDKMLKNFKNLINQGDTNEC